MPEHKMILPGKLLGPNQNKEGAGACELALLHLVHPQLALG